VISVLSLYRATEQEFSFTIPAFGTSISIKDKSGTDVGTFIGGIGITNGTLALVTAISIPSLRLFTAQEWLDFFEMKTKELDAENGINVLQLTRIGESVSQAIESDCNTKFDNNNGSFYSPSAIEGGESPEHHDAKYLNQSAYFLDFIPVNSVTKFEVNQNASGGSPNFVTLTEASNEIVIDLQTGRVEIINTAKYPDVGPRQVRVTYTFGRSTTPTDIRMLAIIETGIRMMGATFIRSKIKNFDEIDITLPTDLFSFQQYRTNVIRKYKNYIISST